MVDKNYDMKGYLKKLKSSSLARIFGNTNTRWFEISFKERTFIYKELSHSTEIKGTHKLSEIKDFLGKLSVEDRKMCDWMFGFQIILNDKKFILYTQTQTEYDSWSRAFNYLLKRKIEPEKNRNSMLNNSNVSDINNLLGKRKTTVFNNPKKETSNNVSLSNTMRPEIRREQDKTFDKSKSLSTNPKLQTNLESSKILNKEESERKINEEKIKKLKERLNATKKEENKSESSEVDIIVNGLNTEKEEKKKKPINQVIEPEVKKEIIMVKEDIEDWNYYDKNNKKTDLENGIGNIIKGTDLNKSMNNSFTTSNVKADFDPNQYRNAMVLENLNLQNNSIIMDNLSIERENNNSIFFENSVDDDFEEKEKKSKFRNLKKDDLKSQIISDKNEILNLVKEKNDKTDKIFVNNSENIVTIKTYEKKQNDNPKNTLNSNIHPNNDLKTKESLISKQSLITKETIISKQPVKSKDVEPLNNINTGKNSRNFMERESPFNIVSEVQIPLGKPKQNIAPQKPLNQIGFKAQETQEVCKTAIQPTEKQNKSKDDSDFYNEQSSNTIVIDNISKQQIRHTINNNSEQTVQPSREEPVITKQSTRQTINNLNDFDFDFGVEKQVAINTIIRKSVSKPNVINKKTQGMNEVTITLGGLKSSNELQDKKDENLDNSGGTSLVNAILKKTMKNSINDLKIFNNPKGNTYNLERNDLLTGSQLSIEKEVYNRQIIESSSNVEINNIQQEEGKNINPPTISNQIIIPVSSQKKTTNVFQEDLDDFCIFPNEANKITNSDLNSKSITVFNKKPSPILVQQIPIDNSTDIKSKTNKTEENKNMVGNTKTKLIKDSDNLIDDDFFKDTPKINSNIQTQNINEKIKKLTKKKVLEDDEDEFEKILKKKTNIDMNKFNKKNEVKANRYIKAKYTDYFDEKLNHSANDPFVNINDLSFNENSQNKINKSFNNINPDNSFNQNDNSFRNPNENSLFGRENFFGEDVEINNSIENSFGVKKFEDEDSIVKEKNEKNNYKESKMGKKTGLNGESNEGSSKFNKNFGFNDSFENNDEWK